MHTANITQTSKVAITCTLTWHRMFVRSLQSRKTGDKNISPFNKLRVYSFKILLITTVCTENASLYQ